MQNTDETIKEFILSKITKHPTNIVAVTAKHFNVTRTTVHRHLNYFINNGFILKSGTTRNIKYATKDSLNRHLGYAIKSNLAEYEIFQSDFNDIFQQFSENINDVCHYGFTEIFNNALDHSLGSKIDVFTTYSDEQLCIKIQDDGVGIFQKIAEYFHISDLRESLFQLTKGKVTTDPTNHTGEGIFFTSRLFDYFHIYANNLHYFRDNKENDWSLETATIGKTGTTVCMLINKNSLINIVSVFKKYQDPDSMEFNRTEIIVVLSKFGNEPFISRSQAKRVTVRLDKFKQITLDFLGVRLVGQGFVDEIFRVFANAHPTIKINYINTSDDVEFMIKRGLAHL